MSSKRPAAPPPELPGFRYLNLLGSGGFSDVYLYEQDRPRRKVAVKVLAADLRTETARRQFETEANLMAQLSSHPYIVTIYEAEITDDGHSYLAMEYCSRPSLDVRYRRERLSVDEVLAIGIQVASAVETAHRAGIAHRDIKPANILVTDYNRPALTDFGISGTVEGSGDSDMGMSIPWSPPESFRGGAVDGVALDVWALGATLYTLLAGRSPFVVPGGDNSQRALVQRIHSSPPARIGRADIPDSLELVLATAMSKSPAGRYSSAHTLALALQRIQSDLNLGVTPFEVLEEAAEEDHPDSEHGETRVRGVVSINPQGVGTRSEPQRPAQHQPAQHQPAQHQPAQHQPAQHQPAPQRPVSDPTDSTRATDATRHRPDDPTGTGAPTRPGDPAWPGSPADDRDGTDEATVMRGAAAPGATGPRVSATTSRRAVDDETLLRGNVGGWVPGPIDGHDAGGHPDGAAADPEAVRRRRRTLIASGAGAAVLVAAVVIGVIVAPSLAERPAPNTPTISAPPIDAVDTGAVPNVTALKGTAGADGVTFTWQNPQTKPGDTYMVSVLRLTGQEPPQPVSQPRITVPKEASGQTCVRVVIRRSDGAAGALDETAPSACVPG